MVTGGGYSASDVITGHWALVRKSVFIGHAPRKTTRLRRTGDRSIRQGSGARRMQASNRPGNHCLHVDEGVSFQVSNFGMYQRLFSVYDGPAFQDSNAYLNIKRREIDDCKPFPDRGRPNPDGRCDPPGPHQAPPERLARRDRPGSSEGDDRWRTAGTSTSATCRMPPSGGSSRTASIPAGIPLDEALLRQGRCPGEGRRRHPPFRRLPALPGGDVDHRYAPDRAIVLQLVPDPLRRLRRQRPSDRAQRRRRIPDGVHATASRSTSTTSSWRPCRRSSAGRRRRRG